MKIKYSAKAEQSNEYELLKTADLLLDDIVGHTAAEGLWDQIQDEKGRTLYTFTISDSKDQFTARFAPDELRSSTHMRVRLNRLWGELLRSAITSNCKNLPGPGSDMAGKTHGDKIDELQKVSATLAERIDNALRELRAVYDAHSETARALADLRREYEKEVALLKREIEDLRKAKDDQRKTTEERARRMWSFGPNALGAVINVLLAAAVAYLVSRQ